MRWFARRSTCFGSSARPRFDQGGESPAFLHIGQSQKFFGDFEKMQQQTKHLNQALAVNMLGLCQALGLQGRVEGEEYVALNPTRSDQRLGSFRIVIKGGKVGVWSDFACNDQGFGGLSLIHYVLCHHEWRDTYQWAKQYLGDDGLTIRTIVTPSTGDGDKPGVGFDASRAKKPLAIWLKGKRDLRGTRAENYLRSRGIDLRKLGRQPGCLRYLERCWHGAERREMPALVVAFHQPDNQFAGIQRIYLPDDRGIRPRDKKLSLGQMSGSSVRLWRGVVDGVSRPKFSEADWHTDTVYLTEGVEDGLAVAGFTPHHRIMVAMSVGNMAAMRFPPCIARVVLAADNDPAGSAAAVALDKAIKALRGQGLQVAVVRSPVGKDFADAAQETADVGGRR